MIIVVFVIHVGVSDWRTGVSACLCVKRFRKQTLVLRSHSERWTRASTRELDKYVQERVKACQRMMKRWESEIHGLSGWAPRLLQMCGPSHGGVRPRTCGSSLGMKGEVRRNLRMPLCDSLGNHPGWKSWGLVTYDGPLSQLYLLKYQGSTDLSLSLCTLPLYKSKYLNTFTISLSTLPPIKSKFHQTGIAGYEYE